MGKNIKPAVRVVIEVGFIVFLFYSNLLMGEFERSGAGQHKGFIWALRDVATGSNFLIAILCGVAGHSFVQMLRKRWS